MSFIIKILLGLIIFNAVLGILGPIFPESATIGTDPTNPEDILSPTGPEGGVTETITGTAIST